MAGWRTVTTNRGGAGLAGEFTGAPAHGSHIAGLQRIGDLSLFNEEWRFA